MLEPTTTKRRESMTQDVLISIGVGVVLTAISYIFGILFKWLTYDSLNWLEVFAVFTSYMSTYLCVVERRFNYPMGAISSAAYAYLFVKSGLFASAVLNAYLVPTLIYGWIRWRKDINTRPVEHIKLKMIPVYLAVAVIGYYGAATISQKFGGSMAWTDSIILAASILAQFLLDNKKIETWIVWAVVNIFAIYTYYKIGLPLVAFQYIFFLANTIYGYLIWKRSMKNGKVIRTFNGDATDYRAPAFDTIR